MVTHYNHQSLQAEHRIKSLTTILTKHLTGLAQHWLQHLTFNMYSYNTFCSPNLHGLSPFELVFGRKPKMLIDVEIDLNIKVFVSYKEYYELLNNRPQYL